MAAVFGLSRAPSTDGVYGLPLASPPILPTGFRQGKSGTATVVLNALPLTGSVLVANMAVSTGSTATPVCTGGGVVSWNTLASIGDTSGTFSIMGLFWGIVGPTPSATIAGSINGVNPSNFVVGEFSNLLGNVRLLVSDAPVASSPCIASVSVFDRRAGSYLIVATSGTNVLTRPSGLVTGIEVTSGRSPGIQYGAVAYQANTPIGLNLTATGVGSKANLAAFLIA